VRICAEQTKARRAAIAAALGLALGAVFPSPLSAQSGAKAAVSHGHEAVSSETVAEAGPPPSSGGFFPLSQVRRGLMGTAWTVFTGTKPEPMQVEVLGVLRGARGPGQDMILAQLLGAKPEYTGVVEGMSGSPVYIGKKLLGSLSYRIGQFSKEPIAGITPIADMLEVRNLPIETGVRDQRSEIRDAGAQQLLASDMSGVREAGIGGDETLMQPMETPLVMSGFEPAAIALWQRQMAGTNLESVAAGGMGGTSAADAKPSPAAEATLEPGSAISAQLVRGDLEISATCTVTYIDPRQLLACGHPILQAGPVSLPMTTADVVTTLASPLNAFKIINTGATVGAFTQDRDSAVRGILGAQAHMIPMHISVDGPEGPRTVNVEVLDLPSLTPEAVEVVLYDALLESNESTETTSYHLTGSIDLAGYPPLPLDLWAAAGGAEAAPMEAALLTGERFTRIYANDARQGAVKEIDLHVQAIPRRLRVELESARLVSNDVVHAGDTVTVEATLRPWQQPERNVRIAVKVPDRLGAGNVRLLVSDGVTLDRTLNQPQPLSRPVGLQAVLAEARRQHPEDRIYVSLLAPEAQAGMDGQTLTSLPLSVANALEPVLSTEDIHLNGESAEVVGEAPADGVLSGFQILNLRIEPGGGLN
jgi:hypothetical protein